MKTKLMSVFVMAFFMISLAGTFVLAEDVVDDVLEVEAGITPDSALYTLDTLADDVSLALTFDEAEKAELAIEIAEERLAETEQMIEEGETEAADEAQAEHDESIADAEEALDEIETNGEVETSEEAIQEMENIRERIQTHSEKVEAVKNRIMEKKSATMSEDQIAHMEQVFGKIIDKSKEMEDKADLKRENAKSKYQALTGQSSEEVESRFAELESEAKQNRAEAKAKVKTKTATETTEEEVEELETEAEEVEETEEETETEEAAEESGNSDSGQNVQVATGEVILVE
jgi:Domain of unknown function (DUF5667)